MIERYEDPVIRELWSREHQLRLWADVELAWMAQLSPAGAETAAEAAPPTPDLVAERERKTRHEFTAFLDCWVARFDGEHAEQARRWVHFGLTSSDVIDTATVMQLVDSAAVIVQGANQLGNILEGAVSEMAAVEQVGRTHGQWAQPRPASTPLQVLRLMVQRQAGRLRQAAEGMAEADLSGPTGARDQDGTAVRKALSSLGLRRAPASTQILPRDTWVHWAHVVANTVTVCEAVAEHYWMLAQSEIAEVVPTRPAPSSAMPHKANPASAENIRGLARLARGLASTLGESIVQRGDRDLAHSSVERVALPDLCHLAATALQRTADVVCTYRYDLSAVEGNLAVGEFHGAHSADAVQKLVEQGSSRLDAMNTIKENPHD